MHCAYQFAIKLENIGERAFPKALSVCALLRTLDGKYILTDVTNKKLDSTEHRYIEVVGGVLSKDEGIIVSGEDLRRVLISEIVEDTGIPEQVIANAAADY
ncbi:MAG: hypothetical protein ACOCXT_02790 [Candidatus Dojkabacteria bacterium]